MRSYIHQTIEVNPSMTEHELKETVAKVIDEKGKENIYKIILDGMRDPEISYNVDTLDPYGNVIEITDQTRPAYQFDKLKEANKGNILGAFVAELEQYPENSMEHQVLCEGVLSQTSSTRSRLVHISFSRFSFRELPMYGSAPKCMSAMCMNLIFTSLFIFFQFIF